MTTIIDTITDDALLGRWFEGESWATWRAILRAAEGLPMSDDDLARFRAVAERDPPRKRVRELWVPVGRRGGKDSIASAIATTASLGDYRAMLRPGERATVMCLACDREQARIVYRYIVAYFQENPLLAALVERETDDGLELSNGVEVVVATNSFRAVRGRTIVAAIMDEVAFYRSEDSATPDVETYHAILPAMSTLSSAMLVGISTPYRRAGLLFQKWRDHYGKDDDEVLVVRGPSRAFNPTLSQSMIDEALARDPEAAAAEWLAEWRSDLADFLDRELVEAALDAGVAARLPQPAFRYVAFADPSGGRGDAFTCAISHAEGNLAVLDALYERRSPFDPTTAVAEAAALLREYGVGEVTGDRYAAQWVVEAFAKEGIKYQQSERDRSAVYLDALPLFASGRARILDLPRLAHQLCSLERRTSRIGRDRIDHPPGGADDCANSAAGSLVLAGESASSFTPWRRSMAEVTPLPPSAGLIFAVLWPGKKGEAALVFVARRSLDRANDKTLVLLDVEVAPFVLTSIVPRVVERLRSFASACGVRDL
ncbi:MAG TPA: hypothetical protein VGU20_02895, partial [Stellaceae bacterium]|nr:hypothetical protein [Stellaceae bacterium]